MVILVPTLPLGCVRVAIKPLNWVCISRYDACLFLNYSVLFLLLPQLKTSWSETNLISNEIDTLLLCYKITESSTRNFENRVKYFENRTKFTFHDAYINTNYTKLFT